RSGELLAGAYNGRGRTLLELMNDPDRALPDLDEAIRLRPERYVLPYIARSKARLVRRDCARAISGPSQALSISQSPDSYHVRGQATLALGDRAGALEDLQEALKRAPAEGAFRQQIVKDLERAEQR